MAAIKAIDIMNYPNQVKDVPYNFNEWEEWRKICTTTFKPFFPLGRFPSTPEELEKHKHIYGTAFYPYESLDELIKVMDKEGYDKVCMAAVKMWSYRSSFKLIFDFLWKTVLRILKSKIRKVTTSQFKRSGKFVVANFRYIKYFPRHFNKAQRFNTLFIIFVSKYFARSFKRFARNFLPFLCCYFLICYLMPISNNFLQSRHSFTWLRIRT